MNKRKLLILGGRRFTPASISGLAFWHDPSLASTVTLSGSDVASIADRSPNARNGSPPAGQEPPYTGTINGRNVISYVAANTDRLDISSATTIGQNVAGFSFFAIIKVSSIAAANRVLSTLGGTGQPRFMAQTNATTGRLSVVSRRLDGDSSITSTATSVSVTAGTAAFCCWQVDYSTGTATLRVSGSTEDVAIAWAGGNGSTSNTAASTAPFYGNGAVAFGGDIGEAAAWPRVLTAAEVAALRTYCMAKWGTA